MSSSTTIHIVGLGVSEKSIGEKSASEAAELSLTLSQSARGILNTADIVFGWERHREVLNSAQITLEKFKTVLKLSTLKEEIQCASNNDSVKNVVIVASGDPLHYGIGRWFTKNFSTQALRFYPAVSSIQAACHRQGLALQDVDVLSLHGRPLKKLRTQLKQNKTLVILTDADSNPQAIAKECIAAGFRDSKITIHESLGYKDECSRTYAATELENSDHPFDPLHVTVVQLQGQGGVYPEFPGIPDRHYVTGDIPGKGMITKREVRLVILSLLQPAKSDVIWDIGAGCGGVAVELAYWNEHAQVYAIECHEERLNYLRQNIDHFGVTQNCHVIAGRAPEALNTLPPANKVFIGGSDGELEQLLTYAWQNLPFDGILVASAVLEKTRKVLSDFACNTVRDTGAVETVELAVKRGFFNKIKNASSNEDINFSCYEDLSYEKKLPIEVFAFSKSVYSKREHKQ